MSNTDTSPLDLVLDLLRCPVCEGRLLRTGGTLRCRAGHSFDIARQGYASLLTGARAISGDDRTMVAARERFLATGAYDPIREAIVGLAADGSRPPIDTLEVGCGTGYYLAGVLELSEEARGIGLDSSSPASRIAARSHPRAAAATCDVFSSLPIGSGSVDLVLDVFAPRNPAEFHRVLRPEGRLLVTRPTSRHLARLVDERRRTVRVDPRKEERLARALEPYFETLRTEPTDYLLGLSPSAAGDLVSMTPDARRPGAADADDGSDAPLPSEVEVSVLTSVYRPRRSAA